MNRYDDYIEKVNFLKNNDDMFNALFDYYEKNKPLDSRVHGDNVNGKMSHELFLNDYIYKFTYNFEKLSKIKIIPSHVSEFAYNVLFENEKCFITFSNKKYKHVKNYENGILQNEWQIEKNNKSNVIDVNLAEEKDDKDYYFDLRYSNGNLTYNSKSCYDKSMLKESNESLFKRR